MAMAIPLVDRESVKFLPVGATSLCSGKIDRHWIRLSFHELKNKEDDMPNVYIEARPKGRSEGSSIEDFVVEDGADSVLGTFKTQQEAITWARKNSHSPLVARVRHLNDKKIPDHWRSV